MCDAAWKGHLICALKLSGYSTSQAKKVLRFLEQSLNVHTEEQAEAVYAKFSV